MNLVDLPFRIRSIQHRLAVLLPAALLLLLHSAIAQAPPTQKDAIDTLVRSYISEHHVPGLSLAVVVEGHVALTEGYGQADLENNVPATSETIYRIASLSKSVTAVAVMKLVEAGKLDLDAPHPEILSGIP
jgi:CubicO group peptidase (beta-lactamase class C family)